MNNTLYPIYILWLRQIKRYFRSRSRIIGSLGQPLLFLLALGYGLQGSFAGGAGGVNYFQFLAPGIISMAILFTAIFSGIEVIWDRQFGFLKETLVAPVSRFSVMLGRTLGGATVATFQGILVLIISMIVGFRPELSMIIPAIIYMLLIALLFTALGTAIASILEDMQGFQLIMNFLVMPLFFLSGALFPLDTAPKVLQGIAYINPLSYGVDALRATLGTAAHFGLWIDTSVLVLVTLAFIGAGAYLFSRIKI
ncbi:MAG: ABC transporter permease [Patescibacteria group bacterium]